MCILYPWSDRDLAVTRSTRIWCGVRLYEVICAVGSSERSTRVGSSERSTCGQPVHPGDDIFHK